MSLRVIVRIHATVASEQFHYKLRNQRSDRHPHEDIQPLIPTEPSLPLAPIQPPRKCSMVKLYWCQLSRLLFLVLFSQLGCPSSMVHGVPVEAGASEIWSMPEPSRRRSMPGPSSNGLCWAHHAGDLCQAIMNMVYGRAIIGQPPAPPCCPNEPPCQASRRAARAVRGHKKE